VGVKKGIVSDERSKVKKKRRKLGLEDFRKKRQGRSRFVPAVRDAPKKKTDGLYEIVDGGKKKEGGPMMASARENPPGPWGEKKERKTED